MRRYWMVPTIVILTISLAASVEAGGRARVKVSEAPKQVMAGRSFDLAIQVIPETWTHRRDVAPVVTAENGGQKVVMEAVALTEANRYRATVVLPSPGKWTIRVDSRYCQTVMSPLSVDAVATTDRKPDKRAG